MAVPSPGNDEAPSEDWQSDALPERRAERDSRGEAEAKQAPHAAINQTKSPPSRPVRLVQLGPAIALLFLAAASGWFALAGKGGKTIEPARLSIVGQAADAAMNELMNTPPTTLAGIRAIIQYLVEWDNDSGYYYLPTLLRSPLLAAERIVDEGDTRRLSGRPFLFHRTAIALAGASRVVIHRAKMRRLNQLSQLRSERGTIKRPRAHIIALLFQPLFYIVNIRKPPGSG